VATKANPLSANPIKKSFFIDFAFLFVCFARDKTSCQEGLGEETLLSITESDTDAFPTPSRIKNEGDF
jgi:hypothetical protein